MKPFLGIFRLNSFETCFWIIELIWWYH